MGDCGRLRYRVEMVELDKFIKIFEGLTSAYGQTIKTDQFSEKGKHKTKSFTISNPVTKKLWREHLEGKDPALGIVPINKENKCKWGCIDIDTYPFDHKKFIQKLKEKNEYKEIDKKMNNQVSIVSKNINFEEVWFLEHEKVFTAGSSSPKNLKEKSINKIPLIHVNRGGKLTYHGPGQLVVYPILDLTNYQKSVSWYMRKLEQVTIDLLLEYDIKAKRSEGLTGVWVDDEKIAAQGVKISKWVTMHGLLLDE